MLSPSFSFSADPSPNNKTEIVLDDVSGGLATTAPSYKIGKQFSPYMRNVIVDNGKIEKPNGFIVAGGSMVFRNIQGIYPFYDDNGVVSYIQTDSSITLSTKDNVFYTFVSSGNNTSVILRCKQARSNMFCSNGIDSLFEWTGTQKNILDGTKGFPTVPKGKYQEYYQERLWEYNLPNNPSEACFSDVKSTNGVALALDNFLAWPVSNCLFVGQGDGQVGTAMWIENGQLQFGKERSIYTLFGTNLGSYTPRKAADIGVASQDSLVMMDNEAHFLGQDGIYRDTKRISDMIVPENELISKDTTRIVQNSWETKSDFDNGQYFGTTVTALGILKPMTYDAKQMTADLYGPDTGRIITFDGVVTSTLYPIGLIGPDHGTGENIGIGERFYCLSTNFKVNTVGAGGPDPTVRATLKNLYTGLSNVMPTDIAVNGGGSHDSGFLSWGAQNPVFDYFQVAGGSFAIQLDLIALNGYSGVTFQSPGSWTWKLSPATTGQFISDVSTLTTPITSWGNFDSLRNTNGGNISFYIHSATSVVNITTQTWTSIAPGQPINASVLNNYVQWATTITSISSFTQSASNIDNVTIAHVEGAGAINRAFGINWKNRYWLFVSTSADQNLSFLLMKSRTSNSNPDAWMPQEGINIRSIAKDNANVLYGGSSSTGVVYRLDYGTNYNGLPIQSIYQTSEQFMSDPFSEKKLFEYYLTADKQAGKHLGLNTYVNGVLKSTSSIDVNGTGRLNRVIQNVQGDGKFFKWEFTNNELDKGMDVTNFGVNYIPTEVRKGANE